MSEDRSKSDLESAVEGLGRVFTGVTGRLFGPKAVGKESIDAVTVSPEVDEALTEAGEAVGRLLSAAGEGLKQHPLDPVKAAEQAGASLKEEGPPPTDDGWSGLSHGVKNLADGLASVAEGVLDVVAPKKPPADDASG